MIKEVIRFMTMGNFEYEDIPQIEITTKNTTFEPKSSIFFLGFDN